MTVAPAAVRHDDNHRLTGHVVPSPGSPLREYFGRALEAHRLFRNWPQVLAFAARDLCLRRRGGCAVDLRNGLSFEAGLSELFAIFEVFGDDQYGLSETALMGTHLEIVDLGAHIGVFTLAALLQFPASHVTCFEPSPVLFRRLVRNIAQNGLDSRTTAVNAAMTGKGGRVTFHSASRFTGCGTTIEARAMQDSVRLDVPAEAFDAFVSQLGKPIDLLKIDIEGGEYDLVRESSPSSWSSVARLALEYHDVPGEDWALLRSALEERGFVVQRTQQLRDGQGLALLGRPDD